VAELQLVIGKQELLVLVDARLDAAALCRTSVQARSNIALYTPESREQVRALGGETGLVPVLLADGHAIWDTLAIAEYVYEQSPWILGRPIRSPCAGARLCRRDAFRPERGSCGDACNTRARIASPTVPPRSRLRSPGRRDLGTLGR